MADESAPVPRCKRPRQSRTLWFNVPLAVISAMLAVLEGNFHLLQDHMTPGRYLLALSLVSGINAALRLVTRLPLSVAPENSE